MLLGTTYATPVDIWSCGCILAELVTRKPLFPGHNESDQLSRILAVLGTPNEEDWPSDTDVMRENFAHHRPRDLGELVPEIETEALDLLQVSSDQTFHGFMICFLQKMLHFDPKQRITARQALAHPYFSDQGPEPLSSPSLSLSSSRSRSRTSMSTTISSPESSMNMSHDTSVSTDSSFCSDK